MSELNRDAPAGDRPARCGRSATRSPRTWSRAMQAAAAIAASDLDIELMELVERSTELVGARGSTAYTLRFVHGDTDLLLRIAVDGDRSRVDGWIVPPEPMTIRALPGCGAHHPRRGGQRLGPLRAHRPAGRADAAAAGTARHRPPGLRHPHLRDLIPRPFGRPPMLPRRGRQAPRPQAPRP